MLKKYKHSVLTDDQIKWIVKQKIEGKLKNEEIAAVQGISVRRVQQIYSLYKKNESLSVLKKAGRHKASVTEEVIIEAYGQFKSCASYLEQHNKTKVWIEDKPYENKFCVKAGGTCNERA